MTFFSYVVGGLVLFLFGVRLTSGGLREAAGGRLKATLSVLTAHRATGLLAGVTVTFLLSSSSAVLVMLVELTNAGLLSLRQAILVILGSTIGTALFLQVIAFNIASWALLILIAGYIVNAAARYRRGKAVGTALIGLALVFLGLKLMTEGVADTAETVKRFTDWLDYRMLGFLIGIILSVMVRSTATVGIAMVLAGSGVELARLVPVVLGAAVGTSSTTLIASATGGRKGKQVALSELIIRLAIAAIFLPLAGPTADFIAWFTSRVTPQSMAERSVANVHMFTSLVTALLVLPFVSLLARLVQRVAGDGSRVREGALQYISFEEELPVEEALSRAHQEVIRMAGMTRDIVRRAVTAVRDNDERELERLEKADEAVDVVDEVLTEYLERIENAKLDAEALEVKSKLLCIIKDLEAIADFGTRDLTHLGWQKARDNLEFGGEERESIDRLLALVDEDLDDMVQAVEGKDIAESLRAEVLERDRDIDAQRMRFFDRQFDRVASGVEGAEQTTSAYMNVLNTLRMMHFLISDIVRVISLHPSPVPGRTKRPRDDSRNSELQTRKY